MFNLIKKEEVMTKTKQVWLVIEKTSYGENNDTFSIAKTADTIEQATTYKVHLDALNDRTNRSYFLASDSETIMERVISLHNKSVANGSYYENNPEVKKPEVKKPSEEEMPF